MKRAGILHAELLGHLGRLGHTDRFLVTDSGFPAPVGTPVVDLRVVFGLPGFTPVLEAMLAEVAVEAAVVAEEVGAANPTIAGTFDRALPALERVPHDELKQRAVGARFMVRTAEATPYANVLLTAGVAFDV